MGSGLCGARNNGVSRHGSPVRTQAETPSATSERARDTPSSFDGLERRTSPSSIAAPRTALRTAARESESAPSGSKSQKLPVAYVTKSGREFKSVETLPAAERNEFLSANDPVRKLGLTNESKFYRIMGKGRVEPSKQHADSFLIQGNPNSRATISNYLALEEPSIYKMMKDHAMTQPDGPEREEMLQQLTTYDSYQPAEMLASDLPEPSLNVMYGPDAAQGALNYLSGRNDRVLVEMTLGDIRKAGGSHVLFDISAALDKKTSVPLILTLPPDAQVPVKIVG